MTLEKKDEQVLFPGVEVEGYTIRPWTLAQAVALAPTLGSLVDIAGASGIGDALQKFIGSMDTAGNGSKEAEKKTQAEIIKAIPTLLPKFLPYAPKILIVSLGVPAEEVDKMDLGKATTILLSIIVENVDYLKNYFGPGNARQSMAS